MALTGSIGGFGPIGFQPVDRDHHPPHPQHADAAVRHFRQPDGHRHYLPDNHNSLGHPALDPEAAPPNASHEWPSAQDQGGAGAVRPGPGPDLTGNNAHLPGGRCEPHRLPGTNGGADAHFVRVVQGAGPNLVHRPGQAGWVGGETLPGSPLFAHLCRRPTEL